MAKLNQKTRRVTSLNVLPKLDYKTESNPDLPNKKSVAKNHQLPNLDISQVYEAEEVYTVTGHNS